MKQLSGGALVVGPMKLITRIPIIHLFNLESNF